MIPRTKVNYNLGQLLRSVFIFERGGRWKKLLTRMLQDYLGEPNVLLAPSGRGGLYFILKAIDKPRVLVPAYTCKAVAEAALLAGKEVVHVEVEDDGFNMSVSEMEKLLDDRSAVVATHQFGIPCEIERIVEIARKKGALVIEDAAASMGSRVNGRLVGTFGDAAFYSFDSTKLITVPMKGGAVTARDSGLFERIRNVYSDEIRPMPPAHKMMLLAQAAVLNIIEQHSLYGLFHRLMFSSRGRFTTDGPGLNQELNEFYRYDLSNWQAYIASRQVCRIEEIIEARRRRYSRLLDGLDGCRAFEPPPRDKASEWACIRFPIRVRGDKIAYYNKAIRHGIDFAFSFTFIACPDSFSNAKRLADSVLDLPFYLKMSDDDLQRVVRVLKMLDEEARRED